MKQVCSQEEFLSGKTVKAVKKSGCSLTLLFSDDTFALFYCTDQGLIMRPKIEIDLEVYAHTKEDGSPRDYPKTTHDIASYVEHLFELGIYSEEEYLPFKKEKEKYLLKNQIRWQEDAKIYYELNQKKLSELKSEIIPGTKY